MNKALCAISNQSRKYKTRIKQYNKSLHLGLPRGTEMSACSNLVQKKVGMLEKLLGLKLLGSKYSKPDNGAVAII